MLALSGLAIVISKLRQFSSELEQRMITLRKAKAELEEEVSERRKAEESVRASEIKFRSLTQSANDAIISADSNGNITSWNKGAETIFGYIEAQESRQISVSKAFAWYIAGDKVMHSDHFIA